MFTSLKRGMDRRWKLLGLATVIFIALASSAYAYWRINASTSPTLYVTATSPPLELRMELNKTEFQQDETITVHLFLKNIGDSVIEIIFPHIGNRLYFIVKASNGTLIYESPRGGFASVDKVTLEPNDVIPESYEWPKLRNILPNFDLPVGEPQSKPVPPGSYMIIGRTEPYLIGSLEEAESWAPSIETPPITITIG